MNPHRAVLRWFLFLLLAASAVVACSVRTTGEGLPTLAPTAQALAFVTDTAIVAATATLPGTFTPAGGPVLEAPAGDEAARVTPMPEDATMRAGTAEAAGRTPAESELLPSATPMPPATPRPTLPTSTPIRPTNTATMYPTMVAPTRTAGPPLALPGESWPMPTAHPFPVSAVPRQGWAAVANGGAQPVDDTTFGQWQYAYGPYMRFSFTNLQHVPMLTGGPRNGLTGTAFLREMDERSAHDYWIVFNECEHQEQCATSPQDAAEFFRHQVVEVLFNQGVDANAKLIVGGVNAHPCGIEWLERFVTYYEANYGELPRAGWHFHLYPEMRPANWPANCGGDWVFDDLLFPDPQTAFALWLSHARSTLAFVQQYGDPADEIWFTEIGCLNAGYHQVQQPVCQAEGFMAGYVPLMLEWLNNEGRWVTRYAWYTDWDSNYWHQTKLFQTVAGETNRELSPAGLYYSQIRAAEAVPLPWP